MLEYNNTLSLYEFINMSKMRCRCRNNGFNLLGIYPTKQQISTQMYKFQTAPACKSRLVWFESPRQEGVCSQPETSSEEFEEFLSSI